MSVEPDRAGPLLCRCGADRVEVSVSGNRFDYLVRTHSDRSGRVAFVACAWDITALSTSNSVNVFAAGCDVAAWPTAHDECNVQETAVSGTLVWVVLRVIAIVIVAIIH